MQRDIGRRDRNESGGRIQSRSMELMHMNRKMKYVKRRTSVWEVRKYEKCVHEEWSSRGMSVGKEREERRRKEGRRRGTSVGKEREEVRKCKKCMQEERSRRGTSVGREREDGKYMEYMQQWRRRQRNLGKGR
ncbi:hypothetical protein ACJRO7_000064 [Eucalyptus globulus]|uniref:Uncharacterized protein n=1 Tax=Eucalyptus globulus TaxID=34317 RepID=A0ABD3LMC7_EUCGL